MFQDLQTGHYQLNCQIRKTLSCISHLTVLVLLVTSTAYRSYTFLAQSVIQF